MPDPPDADAARRCCEAAECYRPDQVRLLLVAHAPPESLERYFYFEDVREKDNLFRYVIKGLSGSMPERAEKRTWLARLREDGVFLIDLMEGPYDGATWPWTSRVLSSAPSVSTRRTSCSSGRRQRQALDDYDLLHLFPHMASARWSCTATPTRWSQWRTHASLRPPSRGLGSKYWKARAIWWRPRRVSGALSWWSSSSVVASSGSREAGRARHPVTHNRAGRDPCLRPHLLRPASSRADP